MRTSSKIIVALAASIVIGAILVCIGVGVYVAWLRRSTKYTLTPEQTMGMFSKTPEEFIINPRPTTMSLAACVPGLVSAPWSFRPGSQL